MLFFYTFDKYTIHFEFCLFTHSINNTLVNLNKTKCTRYYCSTPKLIFLFVPTIHDNRIIVLIKYKKKPMNKIKRYYQYYG